MRKVLLRILTIMLLICMTLIVTCSTVHSAETHGKGDIGLAMGLCLTEEDTLKLSEVLKDGYNAYRRLILGGTLQCYDTRFIPGAVRVLIILHKQVFQVQHPDGIIISYWLAYDVNGRSCYVWFPVEGTRI